MIEKFKSQELKARRADVLQELSILQNNVSVVVALMNNEEVMKKMENMRDSKALNNYLTQESDVSESTNSYINIFLIFQLYIIIHNNFN